MPANTEPRGIRNNNPGNIRDNPHIAWLGQCGKDDKGFCLFSTPFFGLRAMFKNLITYHTERGCSELQEYIYRYAPTSENDTGRYLDRICIALNKPMGYTVSIPSDLPALMKAIIIQENGHCLYDDQLLNSVLKCYPITN